MHTPPSVRKIVRQRVAAVSVAVLAAGLLLGVTASAGAAPTPTLSQVQARLKSLQTKSDQLDQQYGKVKQEWVTTKARLALINKEVAADSVRFRGLQRQIDLIAVADYEAGNLNTSLAMLASGNASNAQGMLDKSSILQELSNTDSFRIREFLASARQLTNAQLAEQRTKAGIDELRSSLLKRQATLMALENKQNALIVKLTPKAAAAVSAGVGGTTHGTYTGSTSTQAGKAVAYAYAQLGCIYVFGGTGPCGSGFDCSGLMMEAWASAGVSIPRDSFSQEADLPQVSLSNLQPGDILGFAGNSHVGMYVGGNKLIDAPHTGAVVELVSLSGWYRSELDEAVRP